MEAIYTDLHIHTSDNADSINKHYDVNLLINKIKAFSKVDCSNLMISLTDHNIINKKAYCDLLQIKDLHVLLGVELHIRNYDECSPYHCHIYFDISKDNIENEIDNINVILSELYPKKMVSMNDTIPHLEEISKAFEKYEYIMLPHGGQSHNTFDDSFPRDKNISFDNALERNIYYNQFDGFTSRSNTGITKTEKYFSKLGINSFVNLITCTDNYYPDKYPSGKSNDDDFTPTWINSKPTFQGLRLALSEKTRLFYQKDQPIFSRDFIKKVTLRNEKIDIDVELTPGLNVIIGGSSSGKTLVMDSIYNAINKSFNENNVYSDYDVESISVENPVGSIPHYINQNYIIKLIDEDKDEGIERIDIIRNTFLSHDDLDSIAVQELAKLKNTINDLFKSVSNIERLQKSIRNIKHFPRLITKSEVKENYINKWIPSKQVQNSLELPATILKQIEDTFEELTKLSNSNPFIDSNTIWKSINIIKQELEKAKSKKEVSDNIIKVIYKYKKDFDENEALEKTADVRNNREFQNLLDSLTDYLQYYTLFYSSLDKLQKFKFKYNSNPILSNGHKLSIESKFELNETKILEAINSVLPTANKLSGLNGIKPGDLFTEKMDGRIRGHADKVYKEIEKENKRKYVIVTKDGKNFESLSPGWKTAILLDIILGYTQDSAPIFIDQPEDNLATNYINLDLINGIKKCKMHKQLIIISHNATIPMLADAQNIILCRNMNGKIVIRSGAMEDSIDGKRVIDSIAEITDGGKASVKKRVKKYNLKSFKED